METSIERVKIFGSRATGQDRKASDIDLAIYGESVSRKTVLDLAALLNEELPIPYHVDVLPPKFVKNQKLLDHIETFGIDLESN